MVATIRISSCSVEHVQLAKAFAGIEVSMKRRIATALCSLAVFAFALLLFVVPAQAKEVTVEATMSPFITSDSIKASLNYDDTIVEGKPTRFIFNVTGCSREPHFIFKSISRKVDNKYESVIDFTYQAATQTNYFEEQLHFSGVYKIEFDVYVYGDWSDEEKPTRPVLDSARFSVEFNMTAAGDVKKAADIINEVVAVCNAQGFRSQYEKALWLNDWIVDNTEYDGSLKHNKSESLFIDRIGTCEAYHEAYAILLNRVGIETRRVDWGGSVNHVWTGAKLDGKWYNIDTTWNDASPSYGIDTKHLYFGMPTEAMRYIRPDWDGTYNAGRTDLNKAIRYSFDATDYEGHYFIKTGAIKTWSNVYAQSTSGAYSVKAHINKKETSFSLPVEKDYWAPNYINSIYPLVAYQLRKTDWGSTVSKLDCKLQGKELVFTVSYISGMWINSGARWWYKYDGATQKATGKQYPYNEFVTINGVDYHFDGAGWMHTGWQYIGNRWYYFNGSGAKTTGWQYVGGRWYHLGTDGKMLTGWKIDGAKYYLSGSGAMVTGWQYIGKIWYLFNGSGAATTGWQLSGGKWYWMDKEGKMRTGWLETGGATYYLSGSGAMVTGWLKLGNVWYYFNGSGAMVKNAWIGNYWLGADGVMVTNSWVDNNKYYVGANGAWVPGKRR